MFRFTYPSKIHRNDFILLVFCKYWLASVYKSHFVSNHLTDIANSEIFTKATQRLKMASWPFQFDIFYYKGLFVNPFQGRQLRRCNQKIRFMYMWLKLEKQTKLQQEKNMNHRTLKRKPLILHQLQVRYPIFLCTVFQQS